MASTKPTDGRNVGFRATPEELEMLETICKCENYTPTTFFRYALHREYDKLMGNPELIQALETLETMYKELEALNDQLHIVAGAK